MRLLAKQVVQDDTQDVASLKSRIPNQTRKIRMCGNLAQNQPPPSVAQVTTSLITLGGGSASEVNVSSIPQIFHVARHTSLHL